MDYLICAARELLIHHGFSPVKDSSGNIVSHNDTVLLFNSEWGRNCLVELIAADEKDISSFSSKFEHGSSYLQNHPEIQEIFYIYVFTSTPENERLDLIINLQLTDYRAGRFLRSIAVNLETKQVLIPARDPSSQKKIRKVLETVIDSSDYVNHDHKYTNQNIGENIEALINSKEYTDSRKQAQLPINRSTPFISWAVLFVNVLVFILMELSGGSENNRTLINFGAKFNPAIQSGEYWRLFTPLFLHIGFFHLFLNCFSLYNLRIIENIYGSSRFLFIYIFAGITGNLASYLLSPSLSAGASGAIFGLMGSLLYIWKIKPRAFARIFGTSVITIIAANIIFGLANSGIDNFAHIGGLAGGYIAALIVRLPKDD